jgi:oligopeptide/dipeptide ABC transporter ATP-binding protein
MSEQAASAVNDRDVILQIRDLHTYFFTDLGISRALNGISLDVPAGKVMGVVGESGCGKSVTALSILRLVPKPGRIVRGEIVLRRAHSQGDTTQMITEVKLTDLNPQGREIRSIRGDEIAMIFQEPMTSLNPSYTVGNQIAETILLHQEVGKAGAEERAVKILDQVGMPNPSTVVKRYPHELSGGMRQRAMIAMALSCTPSILIADEPTTALDVTTEAQILDLMRELQAQLGMTILYITHNLGVVAQMCDTVAVMYLGRVVELATVDALFYDPKHPYTRALLHSIPHVGSRTKARLEPIRGVVPDPYTTVAGCPFHPRCNMIKPGICDVRVPASVVVGDQHQVRCFLYSDQGEDTYEG